MGPTGTSGRYTIPPTARMYMPPLTPHPLLLTTRRWQSIMTKSLTRPFMLFFSEPILQVLGVYMAFIYGVFYRA